MRVLCDHVLADGADCDQIAAYQVSLLLASNCSYTCQSHLSQVIDRLMHKFGINAVRVDCI